MLSVNQAPVAVANATPDLGKAPLEVDFSSAGSADPDGSIVAYDWDFGDGNTSTDANPTHIYATPGTYIATLTVTDDRTFPAPLTDTALVTVTVTEFNTPPTAVGLGRPRDRQDPAAGDLQLGRLGRRSTARSSPTPGTSVTATPRPTPTRPTSTQRPAPTSPR